MRVSLVYPALGIYRLLILVVLFLSLLFDNRINVNLSRETLDWFLSSSVLIKSFYNNFDVSLIELHCTGHSLMLLTGYQSAARASEKVEDGLSYSAGVCQGIADEFDGFLCGVYVILHGVTLHRPDGGLAFFFSLSGVF